MQTAIGGKIRILIVDDHKVVRAGLRSILAEFPRFEVAGEADGMDRALHECARLKPDVMLLDMRLPGGDGAAVCRRAKELSPAPQILVLSSFADLDSFRDAIDAGADGYLLKDCDEEALAAGIVTVASGGTALHPAVRKFLVCSENDTPATGNGWAALTPPERQTLALVADGRTNKEIAEQLELNEKTIRNMMTAIMAKLGVQRRSQAAAYFVRHYAPAR